MTHYPDKLFKPHEFLVFSYDFSHRKSAEGLLRLVLAGIPPKSILAAPRVTLQTREVMFPNFIADSALLHPGEVSTLLGLDYVVGTHTERTVASVRGGLSQALILGARVLPESVVNQFKDGVFNLHPGVLPQNRGLDTVKHAILHDLPLGVTLHKIGRKIDSGEVITRRFLSKVSVHDTIQTLNFKVQSLELELLSSLDGIYGKPSPPRNLADGPLRTTATVDEELQAQGMLPSYLERYERICQAYFDIENLDNT